MKPLHKENICKTCREVKPTMGYHKCKAMFIARATKKFDTPTIRKQASEMWDKVNCCPTCGADLPPHHKLRK